VTVKAEQEENIYDLTAYESASLGVPHAPLLIKAFKAIDRNELPARFTERPSPAVLVLKPGVRWWRPQIKQAIFALEQNPSFFVRWFRCVVVDVTNYTRWRKAKSKVLPAERPKRMNPKKVQEGIRRYLENEHAEGRQGNQKRAWKWAQAAMPGCRCSQVVQALAVVEGGKKPPGRPRGSLANRKSA
jgi:hypothetical protein